MSLTVFYGLFTLAPLVIGLALAALGLARRAAPIPALILTALGVALPIIGLGWMAAEVSAGFPIEIPFAGGANAGLAIYARADALSIYAGFGVAVLVTPLLLWLAWRAASPDEAAPNMLGREQWLGLALAFALESSALSLVFAENIAWLAVCWLLVAVIAWGLGEVGSDLSSLDWRGLALMAVGPIAWLITAELIARPAGKSRMIDLMGDARYPNGHLIVMTLAIAIAAGAWPALGWLRKRANITPPAGLAAVAIAAVPAALFVGARTFSFAETLGSEWPAFNLGRPPVTIGIVLTLLGAVSVLFAGLLALGRRDARSLLATFILAAAGWGLLALGVGEPLSMVGLVFLLATAILGLGAMIAALVASGALTSDLEPDSAGPRVFGQPLRPVTMFAWVAGAATVAGLPLFAGFAPLQMISAASIPGPRVIVPLVALAWAGAALLVIAAVRATAPAFTAPVAQVSAFEGVDTLEAADEDAEDAEDTSADTVEDAEALDEAEEDAGNEPVGASGMPELRQEELPAVAFGVLAVIAGLAPSALLAFGALPAAEATFQPGALDGAMKAQAAGYAAGVGQWLSTPAIITFVVVALLLALVRFRMPRITQPVALSGESPDVLTMPAPRELAASEAGEAVGEEAAEEAEEEEAVPVELAGMAEPEDAWEDLRGAFTAQWITPGVNWFALDASDEISVDESEDDEEDAEEDAASAGGDGESEQDDVTPAPTAEAAESAPDEHVASSTNGASSANGVKATASREAKARQSRRAKESGNE